jgi:hypothetical protein
LWVISFHFVQWDGAIGTASLYYFSTWIMNKYADPICWLLWCLFAVQSNISRELS